MARIDKHPILSVPEVKEISFSFEGRVLKARENEMISSALYANDIHIFGHHKKDDAEQGIYCANGQCSQCMVLADDVPVKACMTPVRPGMAVRECNGSPKIPLQDTLPVLHDIATIETECLIVGAGPAGLSAAIELAEAGIKTILVDDKLEAGGKLTLQTHKFFGSRDDCFAGTRGIDIATLLIRRLEPFTKDNTVRLWLNSPAVGVFNDRLVGVIRDGTYVFVKPKVLLIATGAREKTLAFPNCDLPGIYGAGAFQTLVNRDLIKPSKRLFVCGGGNVGLIVGYHALQAGIDVVGLVEALPQCGGYKVHLDKLKRFGVPVFTSHTILRAGGNGRLEEVTICGIDTAFKPVPGTQKTFAVDTLLIAVGLSPIDELFKKAREYGMQAYAAGDAEEIAEASAAMFSGKIKGKEIIRHLRGAEFSVDGKWHSLLGVLRSKPGATSGLSIKTLPGKVYPVFRCVQEIPCDPCKDACPKKSIRMRDDTMMGIPQFMDEECAGCAQCVLVCPGLAVTLVDERHDPGGATALLTIPYEQTLDDLSVGDSVVTVDMDGGKIGTGTIVKIRSGAPASMDKRCLIQVKVPFQDRLAVAGFRRAWNEETPTEDATAYDDDTIICRCERITKREIVACINAGYRDINQLKAALRTGLGACNGKNCTELILRIFREMNIDPKSVTPPVDRPPCTEVPLGVFAGLGNEES